ncbi:hypothetical protein BDC45DRAFT_236379 [Circinella umbellata]|nr:hypothetical protein BDC45DRAFT_236379 [Circinella umbellata]
MEVSRPTIERSNTLDPMATIQEWEVERAMVLSQLQQYRERAQYLEQKTVEDKKMYDQHRLSLLHEIKIKEVLNEKRIQSTEHKYLEYVQSLQIQLDQEKQERENETKEIHKRYDSMIQNEQKKHERRICGFQQRLSAKDDEYAKLQKDNIRLTQSAPTSPCSPDSSVHSDCDSVTSTDEIHSTSSTITTATTTNTATPFIINNTPVRLLQEKLFKLQAHQDELEKRHQSELEKQKQTFDQERAYLQQKVQDLETMLKQQNPQQQACLERLQKEYQKGAQRIYQERLANIEQSYAERNKQNLSSYRGDLAQMKERFIHETQQLEMHHLAKLSNLVSEHEHSITEIKEQHDNEMEVLRIEHHTALNAMEFHWECVKQDALDACERTWATKLKDTQATMSNDARQVQKYWDTRIAEATTARETELTRHLGELEVVKERLGKEIEKRQEVVKQLNKAKQDIQLHKKIKAIATQEYLKVNKTKSFTLYFNSIKKFI